MKAKYISILLSVVLLTGCNNNTEVSSSSIIPSSSEEESSSSLEPVVDTINIIMASATVPPVMSALESLTNKGKTYALIERGKTYSGIESTSFINLGFDPTVNNSSGVTNANFATLKSEVSKIYQEYPNAHYNFFTVDYKCWAPLKVASEVKMKKSDFTIYMVEDGTATYQYANTYFQKSFTSENALNNYFDEKVKEVNNLFDQALEDSSVIDSMKNGYVTLYQYVFPLATHPNYVHLLQDKVKLQAKLNKYPNSKINQVYGLTESNNTGYTPHVNYHSISQRVSELISQQKSEYLTLMFGQYKDESERLLKRKALEDGTVLSDKKLIFIGGRVRQSGTNLVPVQTIDKIVENYDDLSNEIKQVFLSKSDYDFVYEYLNNPDNYEYSWKNESNEVINAIKEKAFNYYMDYVYTLKLTYRIYGDKYDILFKGHPAETFDSPNKWSGYKVTIEDKDYNFNLYMHKLAYSFHSNDSEGKYIGVLPGGVAAENLAYLGVKTYLCGLASSTYTGYEKTSPILYVLNNINGDIRDDIAINQRYIDEELVWIEDDNKIDTIFLNYGNRYYVLSNFYKGLSEKETDNNKKALYLDISNSYQERFVNWVKSTANLTDGEGASIDNIGRILFTNKQLVKVRNDYITAVDTYISSKDIASLDEEKQTTVTLLVQEAKGMIYSADDLYQMKYALDELKALVDVYFEE